MMYRAARAVLQAHVYRIESSKVVSFLRPKSCQLSALLEMKVNTIQDTVCMIDAIGSTIKRMMEADYISLHFHCA